jgi:thioredoxin-like negative regulator of GroEL
MHEDELPTQVVKELTEDEAELRADELTRKLQSDPSNRAVADELATLLARLGRSMELLALLSARLEEASPEERARLLPGQRAVLDRLAREADLAGKPDEASLFRDALAALDD